MSAFTEYVEHSYMVRSFADLARRHGLRADICSGFLERRFERLSAVQRNLILGDDDRYRPSPRTVTLPAGAPTEPCGPILERVDGRRTMGEILESVGVEPRTAAVNAIRIPPDDVAVPVPDRSRMTAMRRVARLIWGEEVDRALRPVIAVTLVSAAAFSAFWSYVGIWRIERLGASTSALGVMFGVGRPREEPAPTARP